MLLFIAISGIFCGYSKAPVAADEQRLNLCMCLPTMTQMGCEHVTQCVRLVQANAFRITPQRLMLMSISYEK